MLNFVSWIDWVIFIVEIIGCISFATSGAICAIRKKADILGVWILTLIEIFGGGLLRDLAINKYPPRIFWDSEFLILAGISIVIASIWFLVAYFKKSAGFIDKHRHDYWIYFVDAFGVAVFCVSGVRTALANLPEGIKMVGIFVYIISLGTISGIGGGMFRDVFIGEIPMVFRKHFYMTPCIVGCGLYGILYYLHLNEVICVFLSVFVITGLRIIATIYKWNLPVAKGYNELNSNLEDLK